MTHKILKLLLVSLTFSVAMFSQASTLHPYNPLNYVEVVQDSEDTRGSDADEDEDWGENDIDPATNPNCEVAETGPEGTSYTCK